MNHLFYNITLLNGIYDEKAENPDEKRDLKSLTKYPRENVTPTQCSTK